MISLLVLLILSGQLVLLVVLWQCVEQALRRLGEMNRPAPEPQIRAGVQEVPLVAPSAPSTDAPVIWDVLLKRHGEWVAVSKVREGTTAWGNASRTHNMALRSPSGEFIEGKPE